jgi:hypothetical protein
MAGGLAFSPQTQETRQRPPQSICVRGLARVRYALD